MTNSQLMALKSALSSFSQGTDKAAQGMTSAAQQFEKHSQQVLSLIGGSATGKDREVATSIQQAQRSVKEAAAALSRASKTAKDYGASI